MKNSWEAEKAVIDGDVVGVARAFRVTTSMVYKWQEANTDFTDSGTINHIDKIDMLIDMAIARGSSPQNCFAPLYHFANRYDHCCFPLVKKHACTGDLIKDLTRTIGEFGELTTAFSFAFDEDQKIDRKEAEKIKKEGWDLINQILHFLEEVNSVAEDLPYELRWAEEQKKKLQGK